MINIENQLIEAKNSIFDLVLLEQDKIDNILSILADKIVEKSDEILEANKKDLDRMSINDPKYDRLLLNKDRIKSISNDIKNVVSLHSPIDEIIEESILPNKLSIKKIRIPFGLIGIIYEARPNVSLDVFSL